MRQHALKCARAEGVGRSTLRPVDVMRNDVSKRRESVWEGGTFGGEPTFVRDPQPAEFEALLEQRLARGDDLLDGVWEGVYHMNRAPSRGHAYIVQQVAELLVPLARAAGRRATGRGSSDGLDCDGEVFVRASRLAGVGSPRPLLVRRRADHRDHRTRARCRRHRRIHLGSGRVSGDFRRRGGALDRPRTPTQRDTNVELRADSGGASGTAHRVARPDNADPSEGSTGSQQPSEVRGRPWTCSRNPTRGRVALGRQPGARADARAQSSRETSS
jgi:hypothetical protein